MTCSRIRIFLLSSLVTDEEGEYCGLGRELLAQSAVFVFIGSLEEQI